MDCESVMLECFGTVRIVVVEIEANSPSCTILADYTMNMRSYISEDATAINGSDQLLRS